MIRPGAMANDVVLFSVGRESRNDLDLGEGLYRPLMVPGSASCHFRLAIHKEDGGPRQSHDSLPGQQLKQSGVLDALGDLQG